MFGYGKKWGRAEGLVATKCQRQMVRHATGRWMVSSKSSILVSKRCYKWVSVLEDIILSSMSCVSLILYVRKQVHVTCVVELFSSRCMRIASVLVSRACVRR